MSLPHQNLDAVPFTPLTAEFLDNMNENIESLARGTGLEPAAVKASNIDFATFANGKNVVIEETVDLGYRLKAKMTRVGNLVFANVQGTVELPTAVTTKLSERIPNKFCPASSLGTVTLYLIAHNSRKVNGYATYRIWTDGSMVCGATSGHNEWYGTGCWFTDKDTT